jgi:hypothetical protein
MMPNWLRAPRRAPQRTLQRTLAAAVTVALAATFTACGGGGRLHPHGRVADRRPP